MREALARKNEIESEAAEKAAGNLKKNERGLEVVLLSSYSTAIPGHEPKLYVQTKDNSGDVEISVSFPNKRMQARQVEGPVKQSLMPVQRCLQQQRRKIVA